MELLKDVLKNFFRRPERVFIRIANGDEMYEGMNTDDEDGLRVARLIEALDLPVRDCREIAIPGEMGECWRIEVSDSLKRYIVTDPSYLVGYDNDRLREMIIPGKFESEAILRSRESRLSSHLKTPVRMSPAGCGEWDNRICGPGVIRSDFDGEGQVCVCELTAAVKDLLLRNAGEVRGAVFKTRGVEEIAFSRKNPGWTQLILRTSEGVIKSLGGREQPAE